MSLFTPHLSLLTHLSFLKNMIKKILAVLGLAVLIVSIVLQLLFPKEAAWMPEDFASPIVAFEFLQTNEEVKAFFGPPTAERTQWLDAMIVGHQVDYLYLVLYGLFLAFWGKLAVEETANKAFYFISILAVVAALSDMVENWQLVAIVEQIEQADFNTELQLLYIFTWLKWGSLALALAGTAWYLSQNGKFGKMLLIISGITLVFACLAFLKRSVNTTYFSLGIVLQFVFLIGLSWRNYFRDLKL